MREGPHWVAFRLDGCNRKQTKLPVNPHNGLLASPTDSTTWGTLDEAQAAAERLGLPGVGYVLTEEAGIVAVDLDKCRNPETGQLEPMAERIVGRLNSYTEISPSGTGLHIFCKAKLPAGRRRGNGIEMYEQSRFMTVTGQRADSVSGQLENQQEEIEALHVWLEKDAELVERIKANGNDPRLSLLWDGQWEKAGYPSQSEADLALCNILVAWTNRDAKRVDRIFRWSGLMREKWDEPHGAETYGEITIRRALGSEASVRLVGRTAEEFLGLEFPPQEPLVEGLLHKRDMVTLGGQRRHGKTSLLMNLVLNCIN